MKRLHEMWGWILGALVVMVAATATFGTGGVSAAEDDGAYHTGSYGSRKGFKTVCDGAKGTFIDDGDGNLECHYPDGGWTECDAKGGDCWFTPPPKKLEPIDTTVEPIDAIADDPGGGQPVPPLTENQTPTEVKASAASIADHDQDQDTTRKGKKGKHGKRGGKGRT